MPVSNSSTMQKRELSGHDKLVIVLTTIFGILGLSLAVFAALQCRRRQRRRGLFTRGLTPIGDDEIATWKVGRADQSRTYGARQGHSSKDSTISAKIQYQRGDSRSSVDVVAMSPRSFIHNGFGMDLPRVPEAAAFARAPNARAGLTDETIPGADPFVTPLRRQPSRLRSMTSTSRSLSRGNSRARGYSQPERWHSSGESSPAESRSRMCSFSAGVGHFGYDKEVCTELSPPPSRRHDAGGRALG